MWYSPYYMWARWVIHEFIISYQYYTLKNQIISSKVQHCSHYHNALCMPPPFHSYFYKENICEHMCVFKQLCRILRKGAMGLSLFHVQCLAFCLEHDKPSNNNCWNEQNWEGGAQKKLLLYCNRDIGQP